MSDSNKISWLCLVALVCGCSANPQPDVSSATSDTPDKQLPAAQAEVKPTAIDKPETSRASNDRVTEPNEPVWKDLLRDGLADWQAFLPQGGSAADSSWTLKEGVLRCATNKHGWLFSKEEYSDFTLEFEFRLTKRANSGLHFHYSGEGELPAIGTEIQIIEEGTYGQNLRPNQRTGAVWKRVAPSASVQKPAGQWNHLRLHVKGALVQVTLNDKMIVNVHLNDLHDQPPGHLAISNWRGEANGSEFRNMRIRREL